MKLIKYIINDNDIPVLFSTELIHNEVIQKGKSAGFMTISYNRDEARFTARCFGESTSLKIACDKDKDQKIIEDFFNKQF